MTVKDFAAHFTTDLRVKVKNWATGEVLVEDLAGELQESNDRLIAETSKIEDWRLYMDHLEIEVTERW